MLVSKERDWLDYRIPRYNQLRPGESGVYAMRSLKGHSSVICVCLEWFQHHTHTRMCVIELRQTNNFACKKLCTPIFAFYCDCGGFFDFFSPFSPFFCAACFICIVFDPGDHSFFCSSDYSRHWVGVITRNALVNM